MMLKIVLTACALVLVGAYRGQGSGKRVGVEKLEEVFAWKQMRYEFGGLAGQNERIFDVPMGMEIVGDRLFLGFPRRRPEIPATLNYVSLTEGGRSPTVRPYPDLATNDLRGASPIVSVSRPKADSCGRLWLVDTGLVIVNGTATPFQPPFIVIIDLSTDQIIKRHELKNQRDFLNNDPSGMVSTTVDIPNGDCENAFAYIPDLVNNGLVVYSLKAEDSWRVKHNYFCLDPEEGDFDLNGLRFQWDDGAFSAALGHANADGYRTVYFHAMASFSERAVSSRVLRNKTLATRQYHGDDFWTVGVRGPRTQTNIHAVDPQSGVLFSTQPATSSLHCWNTAKPLSAQTIGTVAQDDELLLYPSDMKLDNRGYVWVLSNKFPYFLYSTLDANKDNFRIFRVPITEAIRGTVCHL